MGSPILSVIIPTHNRPEILQKTLDHLAKQTIADQIEVIVVDDNHSVSDLKNARLIEVSRCHQGVARNRGVQEAHGKYVMFIGDDIFLKPDACEIHVRELNSPLPQGEGSGERAILGFVAWDPACGITPVMRWLDLSGWQFGYGMIGQFAHRPLPSSLQHRFTYTSHISLPTETAKQFPFHEDVTLYGWEDIEWGSRLAQAGIALVYEPDAKALHHHHIEMEDSLKRMETLGKSAVMIEKIAPGMNVVPKGWKLWRYRLMSWVPGMRGAHAKAFLRGIALA